MAKSSYHGNSLGGGTETELDKKLSAMTSEDEMSNLLHSTGDFNDRMKIRAALRELKKKKIADQEASKAAARKGKTAPQPKKKKELHLDGVKDENVLRQMLNDTDDAEQKHKIQAAIRALRQSAREVAEDFIIKDDDEYKKQHHHQDEDIPAVSIETVEFPKDESGVTDFTVIIDIPMLEKLLSATEDFGERTQIRSRLKELHDLAELEVPDYPGARRISEGLDADVFQSERDRRRSSLIDRAALEELTLAPDVEENIAYDEIEDPAELEKLLENAVDIGEKRMIRGALKTLRKKLEGGGETAKSRTTRTDLSSNKPEIEVSLAEEPSKENAETEDKTTSKFEDRSKKSDSSCNKTETLSKTETFEVPESLDSNKTTEKFQKVDVSEKKRETLLGSKSTIEIENENREKSAPSRSTLSWESGKTQRDEIIPSKSSTITMLPPKEKNNNDISIKPALKLSATKTIDIGKSNPDAPKLSTPSKLGLTRKENEKNKKESTLGARLSKFTTPTSDTTEVGRRDRSTATTPSSVKLDKNGKEASLLSSRLSKFSTPPPETTRGKYSSSSSLTGSKLESLKSKFSGIETPTRTESKVIDRALKGTRGKVSEAASKFGGSCSGSSCGTTPSQSPVGSAPSSPKRTIGKISFGSPVPPKAFEFGKIHNRSIAPSPRTSKISDTPPAKTKSSSSLTSQNVPSSNLATSRFETSATFSTAKTTAPSTFDTKKDLKSTTFEVPLGREFSLELQTSGDKTIKVESSSKSHSSFGTPSSRAESKFGDRVGLKSPTERTDQLRKRSPTERKEEAKEERKKVNADKMPPVDDIEDEEALEKMLEAASEFEERKKIRARLREIRKKKREEQDLKMKAMQDEIQQSREDTKANRLKAFDKTTPVKKDTTTTVSKTPLNNNTIIATPSSDSSVRTSSTTIEETDGKSKTMTTKSVIEGPGSKTVISTTLSKSEDKDTKSASMKQDTMSVKKEDTSTGSSFSSKSSSVSSSVTSSSSSTPAPKKLTKFEAEMEQKKKQREAKRADEEKNWKEYMAKKKQDDYDRKKQEMESSQKKKDALMNKFGGKKAEGETGGFGRGTGMSAVPNASTIKQKLLEWCQRCARGYPEVPITNFSSCWADGMAFCAIVHYHFPNAFDFDSLDKKNRRKNLDLAFDSAEKHADIMPLLETDDMIMMKNKPDWKCVFTYVQSLYRHLSKLKH